MMGSVQWSAISSSCRETQAYDPVMQSQECSWSQHVFCGKIKICKEKNKIINNDYYPTLPLTPPFLCKFYWVLMIWVTIRTVLQWRLKSVRTLLRFYQDDQNGSLLRFWEDKKACDLQRLQACDLQRLQSTCTFAFMAHHVKTVVFQCWFNVLTLNQHWYNVVSAWHAYWQGTFG